MYNKKVIHQTLTALTLVAISGFAVGMVFFVPGEDESAVLTGGQEGVNQTHDQDAHGEKSEEAEQSKENDEADEAGEADEMDEMDEAGEAGDSDKSEEADGKDQSEQVFEIPFTEVPQSVQRTYRDHSNDAKPSKVERIVDEDVTKYEIEYEVNGGTASVTLTDHGKLIEVEMPVDISRLPKAVLAEIKKDYPNAEIKEAGAVQLFYYEMDVVVDGKVIEVGAFANGDIEDRLTKSESDKEDHAGDNENDENNHEDGDNDKEDNEDNGNEDDGD